MPNRSAFRRLAAISTAAGLVVSLAPAVASSAAAAPPAAAAPTPQPQGRTPQAQDPKAAPNRPSAAGTRTDPAPGQPDPNPRPQSGREGYTRSSHWVLREDGTVQTTYYTGAAYRKTDEGGWGQVDARLADSTDADMPVASDKGLLPIKFGRNANRLVQIDMDRGKAVLSAPGLKIGKPQRDGDTVVYRNVATDADLRFTMNGQGFGIQYVMKSPRAPQTVRFRLQDKSGQLGRPMLDKTGGHTFTGSIQGDLKLSLSPGHAYQQSDETTSPGVGIDRTSASMKITQDGDTFDLVKAVDPAWAKGKTYPIILDPQVVLQGATEVRDCHLVSGTHANTSFCLNPIMEVGYTTDTFRRRSILDFGLNAVPYAARVDAARVYVSLQQITGTTTSKAFYARPLGGGDFDNSATWNVRRSGVPWVTAGGDIGSPLASFTWGPAVGRYSFDMTAEAQRRVDATSSYYGVAITAQSETAIGVYRFHTSQNSTDGRLWPSLVVDYTPRPNQVNGASATGLDSAADVYWNPPIDNGGPAVTSYTIKSYRNGGIYPDRQDTCTAPCSSFRVPSLVNGSNYFFGIVANNSIGGSQEYYTNTTTVSGAPKAVQNLTATPLDGAAQINWQPPLDNGGSAITSYFISAEDAAGNQLPNKTCDATCRTVTYTGLTNGTTYAFKVAAQNTSPAGTVQTGQGATVLATPRGRPTAPTAPSATADASGQITVRWGEPANSNGATIVQYEIRATDTTTGTALTTRTCPGDCRTTVYTGLTNGRDYRFEIRATNAGGTSDPAVATARAFGVPSQPTGVQATAGDQRIDLSWAPPTSDGGSAVTAYDLTITDNTTGATTATRRVSAADRTAPFTGLVNGRSYTAAVAAVNSRGAGAAATTPPVVPFGAPMALAQPPVATAGDTTATVTWQPADPNGSPITGYRVTANDLTDGTSAPARTCDANCRTLPFTGLINGHQYTFSVSAANNAGVGAASTSNQVRPAGKPGTPPNAAAKPGDGIVEVSWEAADPNGAEVLDYTVRLYRDDHNPDTTDQPEGLAQTASTPGTITFTVPNGVDYYATVVARNDIGSSDPARTSTVTPKPPLVPLTTVKTVSPNTPRHRVGDVVEYTLTIDNPNAFDDLTTGLTDAPADGLRLLPLNDEQKSCGEGCTVEIADNVLTFTGLKVDRSDDREFTYAAQIEPDAVACRSMSNSAAGAGEAAWADVLGCDTGLGLEPWWTTVSVPVGPQSTASVNVANGNLIVQAVDSTPVQAHGRLSQVLRRTYNSQTATAATLPGSLGAGWSFNFGEADDTTGVGLTGSGLVVPTVTSLVDQITTPLSVVLVDRDGTRHRFTPRAAAASLDALTGPQQTLAPRVLRGPSNRPKVCVAQTYDAPDGVHLGLWRYVATEEGTSCSSLNEDNSQLLGFAAVRPDRLRTEYTADGRLLSMTDGNGVELRYRYKTSPADLAINRLDAVYEERSCRNPDGTALGQDDPIPTECRAFEFAYANNTTGDGSTITVTDPANRPTVYHLDGTALNSRLVKVTNPDSTTVQYAYGCDGQPADHLCTITDPNGAVTRIAYDTGNTIGAPGRVTTLTDRRGTATLFSYISDVDDTARTVVETPDADGAATLQRRDYQNIDSRGRVGLTEEGGRVARPGGATEDVVLRRTAYTWDKPGTATTRVTCAAPEARTDNNLCKTVRSSLTGTTPDETTAWTYNNEGMVLTQARATTAAGLAGEVLTTTHGYESQYVRPDGTDAYTDEVTGDGDVDSSRNPAGDPLSDGKRGAAGTLFAISDRTQSLTPRGNAAGVAYGSFLTTHLVDNANGQTPGAVHQDGTCAGTPERNTGNVCETNTPGHTAPATEDAASTRTVNAYDSFGQKTRSWSPNALKTAESTTPGQAVGTARPTVYTYYADNDRDLSGTVSAGGWLKAVSDPTGDPADPTGPGAHFVAFGYDAAGNPLRTWDRDATQGRNVSDYPGTLAEPGPGAYDQTLRLSTNQSEEGRRPTAEEVADAARQPWRYVRATTDPVGNATVHGLDNNGNPLRITPPRGTDPRKPAAAEYTITATYDPGDLQLTSASPLERDAGTGTRHAYDAHGNRSSTRDPNGHHTVVEHDSVNRPVHTTRERGTAAGTPGRCRNANTGDAPIAEGTLVCDTRTSYDGVDNPTRTLDADQQATETRYDAAHRAVTVLQTREPGDDPASTDPTVAGRLLRTETRYDADGNATDVCRPRQFQTGSAGGGTAPGDCPANPKFGTHTDYSASGKALGTSTWRDDGTELTTSSTYDADGNTTDATDPNGARTAGTYDLLGRRTSSTNARQLTTRYMYSPSGDMIATFAPGDAPAGENATGGDNPAGTVGTNGRKWRITGTTYDANHRPVDTVQALAVSSADPPNDRTAVLRALESTGFTDETAQTNLRSRVHYDPDGRVTAAWNPRAFGTVGTVNGQPSLGRPDSTFLLRTVHDQDGRPTAQYSPRTGDSPTLTDPTGDTGQQEQCTKTAPAPEFDGPAHASGTGLCETRLDYDPADNVTAVRLPTRGDTDGRRVLNYAWTADNLLATVTGPDPSQNTGTVQVLANEYDATGRTVRTLDALGNGTATTYTADGLVRRTADSLGANGLKHVQAFDYDHDGNQTCAATLAQTASDTTPCADRTQNQNPVTLTTTSYTNDGKPAQQTDGRTDTANPAKSVETTTKWAYDPNGNPKEIHSPSAVAEDATNPGGVPTRNTYTPDNLLETVTVPVLTEADNDTALQSRVTTYTYDRAGRKTTANTQLTGQDAADAGTQTFTYYPSDLLRGQTGRPQGDGKTVGIDNRYDAAGSMTSTTDRRLDGETHTVTASYYADQLLRDIADGERRTGYAYDGAGGLTARAEGGHDKPATRVEHTVRNDAGIPSSTQNPLEGAGATSDWAYDKAGRLTTETRRTPQAVRTQQFVRAGDDLLTGTSVHAGDSTSAPLLASWQYTHDNAGRILTQAHYGQAAAPTAGGTSGQAVPESAPVTYRYDYDHAGRLNLFTDPRGKRTVRFDADGNRTVYGQAGEPDPRSFTYRADDTIKAEKIGTGLTAPTKTYAYETFGGLADDGCSGYGYDGLDRLTRAAARVALGCEATAVSTVDYSYDGLDRQVARTANGPVPGAATETVTRLSYDGWGQQSTHETTSTGGDTANARILQYALRPDGTVMTAHSAGGTDPLAPTGAEQLAEDGTGSTGLITSPDATVRCTARYDAYGSTDGNTTTAPTGSCNTGRSASEIFYRGSRKDTATGQYQLGSRTYDPAKAAFLTPDVYRTEGSAANTGVGTDPLTRNSYGYVNGDPINMADPSGHKPECGSGDLCRRWASDHDIRGRKHGKAVLQARAEHAYRVEHAVFERDEFIGRVLVPIAGGQLPDQDYVTGREFTEDQVDEIFKAGSLCSGSPMAFATTCTISQADLTSISEGHGYSKLEGRAAQVALMCLDFCLPAGIGLKQATNMLLKVGLKGPARQLGASTAAQLCSFTGTTLVLMADGRKKRIEDVQVGDMVLATDPETGEQKARRVERVFVHKDRVTDLVVDGEVITTTEDHPFWSVTHQRFVRADELAHGTQVLRANGDVVPVSSLMLSTSRASLAYNLAVEGIHTYHVGESELLVHNVCSVPGKGNYRELFKQAHPTMPSDYQVHHALPQRYAGVMQRAGVNIHEPSMLRGVDPGIHSRITTEWARWHRGLEGRMPTAQEVTRFSYRIDERYGASFVW